MPHTVGQVARMAGISVRTLHHYHELGLLVPSQRTEAGYRLYSRSDIERLQEILFYRELGLPLEEIAETIAEPERDRFETLAEQRAALSAKRDRVTAMIELIDRTLISMERGIGMTDEEMLEVFGDFDPREYEDEVEERWGDTDAYRESARRTKRYTKADWQRFKDEQEAWGARAIALQEEGVAPDDPRAMEIAEEARLQIDTWFYPCSHEMHVNLAEMYIADPRFTATYEKMREGMAHWYHDAIVANAKRAAGR